ncbi:MAG: ribonuclease J [Anaerolineales bacterium]|nr:ribonuclease J [Anaerolineales bacterium]
MSESNLRIIPLGGLGEIGKNMISIEYGDQILIVDLGIMFPESDMLGIDYIIPDFQYLVERKDKVVGIVITHGHEDHTGAIRHVFSEIKAPIYATPLTIGLLKVKLKRSGMLDEAKLHTVRAGESFQVGLFKVEFCHVCHSIPDGVALGITSPEGLIVHSGDYKFDHTPVDNWPTDYAKLSEFAGRGVLALLADSTNADEPGWTPSERVIDPAFEKVFKEAKGRVIVATFASLISRMEQVMNAAEQSGRKLAFVGHSMQENAKMAQELGYLEATNGQLVSLEQALSMNPSKIALMCTGSQGEPSSILGRLAAGRNRQFDIEKGDTVVLSSHPIPGNEEMVARTINRLFQRGANVIYDPIAPVHVSGHASQEEMKLLIHLVKPKFLIPIHGELRHLYQHAELAKEVGIPSENIAIVENGSTICFKDQQMSIGERVPGGYVFVDGARVGDVGFDVVRQREALSRAGVVIVNVLINHSNNNVISTPKLISHGFFSMDDCENELSDAIIEETISIIQKISPGEDMKQEIERGLRSFIRKETKTRPMVFAVVNTI